MPSDATEKARPAPNTAAWLSPVAANSAASAKPIAACATAKDAVQRTQSAAGRSGAISRVTVRVTAVTPIAAKPASSAAGGTSAAKGGSDRASAATCTPSQSRSVWTPPRRSTIRPDSTPPATPPRPKSSQASAPHSIPRPRPRAARSAR